MFANAATGLLLLLALASPVTAQDTRAAQLERERAAKATRLATYKPSKLEAFVKKAEEGRLRRLISPHNGFFAEYGYTHKPVGSGIGLGGGWRHDLFDHRARLELEAGASLRSYRMLRADFALPRLAAGHLELGVEGLHQHHPQEDFYGLGLNTRRDGRVSYLFEGRTVEGRAIVRPRPWLELGTRFGLLNPKTGPGEDSRYPSIEFLFVDAAAPGLLA